MMTNAIVMADPTRYLQQSIQLSAPNDISIVLRLVVVVDIQLFI
jgi:hypothetical protein